MGILSPTISLTRYRVHGKIDEPVMETIVNSLKSNIVLEIDNEDAEKSVGWTSFENPFKPHFDSDSIQFGTYMVFSMRIDKKSVPAKTIRKNFDLAVQKKLADESRNYLSRNERKLLKEEIVRSLLLKMPSTPNIYDLLWSYEEGLLWFFTNQKAANEELEVLFSKTFGLILARMFPYTQANYESGLSPEDIDIVSRLTPTNFTE